MSYAMIVLLDSLAERFRGEFLNFFMFPYLKKRAFHFFSDLEFSNPMKTRAGGLYWKLLSHAAQNHYKLLAQVYNYEEERSGRAKVQGFWLFAQELCGALKEGPGSPVFNQMAISLNEESQQFYDNIFDPYHILFIRDVHYDIICNNQ